MRFDSKEVEFISAIGIFIFAIALIPLAIIWGGFVISNLWEWLIVPIFPVPTLSIWQAMGVSCFINYFTMGIAREKPEGESFQKALIKAVFQSLLILLIGYCVSLTY